MGRKQVDVLCWQPEKSICDKDFGSKIERIQLFQAVKACNAGRQEFGQSETSLKFVKPD